MTVYSQHQPTQNMHWNTLRQKFPKSPQPSQHQLSWFRKRLPSYLGGFESKNRIFPLFSKMDLDKLGNRRFPKFSLVIFGTHDNVAGGLRASSHRVPSPESQVHLRSIHAISTIESMKVRTYHFTRVPSMTWMLHDNTFWRWGLGLVLKVGSSKKLDPTLNTSSAMQKIIKIWLKL